MGRKIRLRESQVSRLKDNLDENFEKHSFANAALLGTFQCEFEQEKNVQEDSLGIFRVKKTFCVYVYGNDDGNIPHVHIFLEKEKNLRNKSFDCCVKLGTNDYFIHGCHKDTMNKKQQIAFHNLMKSPYDFVGFNGTTYEFGVSYWNKYHQMQVNILKTNEGHIIIPNYSTM